MRFDVQVEVSLRKGIADPPGATIERSLPALGFEGVDGVRVGKSIRFTIEAPDEAAARGRVEAMCERFLTNPVIEDSAITLANADGRAWVGPHAPEEGGLGCPPGEKT